MQHSNRSVPSLPSERNPQYDQPPQLRNQVPFDPTATLDRFTALHISDPIARSGTAVPHPIDPTPRAPSVMSMRSLQSNRSYPSRQGTTQPSGMYYPQREPLTEYPAPDNFSYQSHNDYHEGYNADRGSIRSEANNYSTIHQQPPLSGPGHYTPQWGNAQSSDQNFLYAASDVLGVVPQPPPGPLSPLSTGPPTSYQSHSDSHYRQNTANSPSSSIAPSHYTSHNLTPNHQHVSDAQSIDEAQHPYHQRPANSAGSSGQRSRAVDLSSPPFTKEYIDQYRQRIKADPDPESHFLFAKYLIDAAKHIRSRANESRAAKKYSEMLVTEALKVIRRLATQGDPYAEAQFFLANCHGSGALGLQVDHERAYHLYLQAAKQNHPAASYRVAVCNDMGIGTKKESSRAAAFYRKAATLGDTAAMYKLGMILLHGSLEQPKNLREAIAWLKRAAEQADEENPHALHELGLLHDIPNSQLVPYDPSYAKSLFTQAAQLGYTASQFRLGQLYEYGSVVAPIDPRRSIAWYTKAAEKGYAEAELALSGWYLTGSESVLKQSDSEAYLWARRAGNRGLSNAEYAVGYYAEVGIGVKQDIEFARRWYMRAAGVYSFTAVLRIYRYSHIKQLKAIKKP